MGLKVSLSFFNLNHYNAYKCRLLVQIKYIFKKKFIDQIWNKN